MTDTNDALRAALEAALSGRDEDRFKTIAFVHRHEIIAALTPSPVAGGDLREAAKGLLLARSWLQHSPGCSIHTTIATEDGCRSECSCQQSDQYKVIDAAYAALATLNQPAAPVEAVDRIAETIHASDPDIGCTWAEWVAYAEAHPDHLQAVDYVRRQARAVASLYAHPPEPAASTVAQGVR